MKKPRLSVVTITRNALVELKATVESVLSQEWEGIEHIVVDGQSEDGTIEYLSRLVDQRVQWLSERDSGIYDAMNKGMARARGDYLLFLNSGDVLVGQILVAGMELDRLLPVKSVDFWGRDRFQRFKSLRLGMPYCHQGIIFKNQGLARFDTRYRIAADYEFFLANLDLAGLKEAQPNARNYVMFDSGGISNIEFMKRDLEAANIIRRRFGRVWWAAFWARQAAKLVVRRAATGLRLRFRESH